MTNEASFCGAPYVEQLAISAVARREGGGAVQLEWEQTRVAVPFVVVR